VADQRADPASVLHMVRDAIALRRERADLRTGAYAALDAPKGAWAYRRGDGTAVALNLSGEAVAVAVPGTVLLATDRRGEGEPFRGELAPWTGVVLDG
jgi:glycosidase